MTTSQCKSCGEELQGPYCHACGQKRLEKTDKSIRHIFGEVIHSFLFVENKFYRSLKLLLSKPAEMPRAYIGGATNKYLKPVQFFFIANLVYFIYPVFATFNTSFNTQLNGLPHSSITKPQVISYLQEKEIDFEEYQDLYNRSSTQISKTIVILIVPMFALVFQLLNLRQKQLYFADHLTMSFYLLTFFLLFMVQLIPAVIMLFYKQLLGFEFGEFEVEVVYSSIMSLSIVWYVYMIFKGVTGQKRIYIFLKALLVAACLFPIIQLYRLLLLLVTMSWLEIFRI